MEERVLQNNAQYGQSFDKVYQNMMPNKNQEPRQIIAKGIELSTGIKDKEKISELTDRTLKGDSAARNGNYDVFLFGIAESLEKIKCETSSINEYFEWMDDAQHIMNNMTDGFVSKEDLAEKNDFIANSWQRETEILICLGLYERSNNPMAAQRVSEMTMKLRRLRQLRSALVNNTKNTPDKEPMSPQEKARLAALLRTLRNMRRADEDGDYYNENVIDELKMFRAAHTDDIEFYPQYSFYTRMLDDQRQIDLQKTRVRTLDYVDRLENLQQKEESKENVRDMIFRLTGRKISNQPNALDQRSRDYMHSHHEQAFDAERYKMIIKMREREQEED